VLTGGSGLMRRGAERRSRIGYQDWGDPDGSGRGPLRGAQDRSRRTKRTRKRGVSPLKADDIDAFARESRQLCQLPLWPGRPWGPHARFRVHAKARRTRSRCFPAKAGKYARAGQCKEPGSRARAPESRGVWQIKSYFYPTICTSGSAARPNPRRRLSASLRLSGEAPIPEPRPPGMRAGFAGQEAGSARADQVEPGQAADTSL
jgi:hypothetical protein